MSTRKAPSVTQADYQTAARSSVQAIADQAKRFSDIAKFLTTAPDFSPATLNLLREAIEGMSEVEAACKRMRDISLKRGNTYFDEQKAALNRGTLRLVRRDAESAAE